jgi:hypothetical protein
MEDDNIKVRSVSAVAARSFSRILMRNCPRATQVAVRVRPLSQREKERGCQSCVRIEPSQQQASACSVRVSKRLIIGTIVDFD